MLAALRSPTPGRDCDERRRCPVLALGPKQWTLLRRSRRASEEEERSRVSEEEDFACFCILERERERENAQWIRRMGRQKSALIFSVSGSPRPGIHTRKERKKNLKDHARRLIPGAYSSLEFPDAEFTWEDTRFCRIVSLRSRSYEGDLLKAPFNLEDWQTDVHYCV
ncbi:hypothetical protein EJB05_00964, partial [Eragrostis curvula]